MVAVAGSGGALSDTSGTDTSFDSIATPGAGRGLTLLPLVLHPEEQVGRRVAPRFRQMPTHHLNWQQQSTGETRTRRVSVMKLASNLHEQSCKGRASSDSVFR